MLFSGQESNNCWQTSPVWSSAVTHQWPDRWASCTKIPKIVKMTPQDDLMGSTSVWEEIIHQYITGTDWSAMVTLYRRKVKVKREFIPCFIWNVPDLRKRRKSTSNRWDTGTESMPSQWICTSLMNTGLKSSTTRAAKTTSSSLWFDWQAKHLSFF